MRILTVNDLVNYTSAKLLIGNKNIVIGKCIIDSKKVVKDSCFFGIKGKKVDGSLFYKEAIKNGANILILSKRKDYDFNEYKEVAILIAEDTTKVLQELAAYKRSLFKGPVIGITGSVGKTSTKEIISNVLSQKYSVLKTSKNHNSQLGVPLTILGLKDEEVMVIEMGMSSLGNIHNLSLIVKPDIAVITNICSSHIKNLKTKENILKAKLEITDGMNIDGVLIINNDDDYLKNVDKKMNVLTYGINNKSNIMPSNIRSNIKTYFDVFDINNLKIDGPYEYVYNVLPAYIIGKLLGLSRNMIKNGINMDIDTSHRLNLLNISNNIKLIDDTYNSSYESIKTALDYIKFFKGRKILVLADILELGKQSRKIHNEVGLLLKKYDIDILVTIGKHSKLIGKNNKKIWLKHYKNEYESRKDILKILQKDDVILLKGSNGMKLINLVNYVKVNCK